MKVFRFCQFTIIIFSIVCLTFQKKAYAAYVPKTTHYSCDTFQDNTKNSHFEALHNTNEPLAFDSNNDDFDIFLQLMKDSTLDKVALLDSSVRNSLFIPRDLAMKQSAVDIVTYYENGPARLSISEKEAYDVITKFTQQFKHPNDVLIAIMNNHISSSELSFCEIFNTTHWTSWAGQEVLRYGVYLVSQDEQFFHPMINVWIVNVRTAQGYIHSVDRLLMPDLSSHELKTTDHNLKITDDGINVIDFELDSEDNAKSG